MASRLAKGNETHKESFITGLRSGIELPVTARPSGRTREIGLWFKVMGLEPRRRDRIREGLVKELLVNTFVGRLGKGIKLEALAICGRAIDED